MRFLLSAAITVLIAVGATAAVQARDAASFDRVQLAQMDSPGDGLDGRTAIRQGNARSYRMRRARHHRVRHQRRHR